MGLISFVGNEERMIGSQFFFTLGDDLTYLDEKHCVFGEVVEGYEILELINEVICDTDDRPYQDVRITHTVILDDPYPDPKKLSVPSRSPSPSAERLQGGRIAPDEEIDETEGKNVHEVAEKQAEREAKARATILEMVGDLPDADMAPPENVLFVCKLNPVTTDEDLEIIFNRFGKIKSCEVIRDRKTDDSLQYAFIEFEDQKSCEDAYFKMDNILIDDRRIHVDFSQSVSKIKWHGKGRGVTHYDENGKRTRGNNNEIGKGNYKVHSEQNKSHRRYRSHSKSPTRSRNAPEKEKDRASSRRIPRDNSRNDRREVSQTRSRSPQKLPTSVYKNDRKEMPTRKERSRSPSYRRKHEDHSRNRNGNQRNNRNRSISPRQTYEKRRHERNSYQEDRYAESSKGSSKQNLRQERKLPENQDGRKQLSDHKTRDMKINREESHHSREDSRSDNKKYTKMKIERNYSNDRQEKKVMNKIDSDRRNKKRVENTKHRKSSSESEEEKPRKSKKKLKKPQSSSSESTSSDSSTETSSSESSSESESSDSFSSDSDSSDSKDEKMKRKKNKKRTKHETTDSDSESFKKTKEKNKKKETC
ncbi:hypothetical protein JTB14_028907 [Gonioctena quinquepunctata]|nr:hypothetical protein JTB14_028907 [Gonioctena quinquepunctata]